MDLSVIIRACGARRHIAACLRSVTRCPRETIDMECIVVSSSAGETAAVVGRYGERDNRIKLFVMDNGDTSDACNTGIEKASGRYILFLDAADRLCEDAWEQIEAAVEEEYADLVAFSWITSRRNGRLKAWMLPISDVISTDESEARRLMYADSALSTCGAKLFKSRIIRDNNLFFMPAGADLDEFDDLYFVTEYFEHCESYLMTKAMILYCPQKDRGVMKNCGMEERLEMLGKLYDLQAGAAGRCQDDALMRSVQVHYLRVLTELFCRSARENHYGRSALETIYAKALENRFLRDLIDGLDERWISPGIRRYEYRLFRTGSAAKIRRYFCIKARLQD